MRGCFLFLFGVISSICVWASDELSIDNELIASWEMNWSLSKVVPDSSGNGHDMTLVECGPAHGLNGGAIRFFGSKSRADIPAEVFNEISGELSISIWTRHIQTDGSSLFAAQNSQGGVLNVHAPWRDNRVYWDAGRARGEVDRIHAPIEETLRNQWNHWVFTKSATTGEMAVYLNGELHCMGEGKRNFITNLIRFRFGINYDGVMDEIKIYKVALTPTHVDALYNNSFLNAAWSVDPTAGGAIKDISGNQHHAGVVQYASEQITGLDNKKREVFAMDFDGENKVSLPVEAFQDLENEVTVSFWAKGKDSQPKPTSFLIATGDDGKRRLNIHLPWADGKVYWDAGNADGKFNRVSKAGSADVWGSNKWNHWVFTKNAETGQMAIYLNGSLWAQVEGKTYSLEGITRVTLGGMGSHMYKGLVADLKVYDVSIDKGEAYALYQTSGALSQTYVPQDAVWTEQGGVIEGGLDLSTFLELEKEEDLASGRGNTTVEDDHMGLCKRQAAHFLSQASMGGSFVEVNRLARNIKNKGLIEACSDWIDQQFRVQSTLQMTDMMRAHRDRYVEPAVIAGNVTNNTVPSVNIQNFELLWWDQAVRTNEQLRFRFAYALSQVFVTSAAHWNNLERNDLWTSYSNYYDKLLANAFGTHRELLQVISYDPFMGVYLSSAQNRKADPELNLFPDENYAREVMQLFSCGVYSQSQDGDILHDRDGAPIENYGNDDIRQLAKVFTGLGLRKADGSLAHFFVPPVMRGDVYVHPMQMVQQYHDTTEKRLFDDQLVIPENGTGDDDIRMSLDFLATHPSTAPNLSRMLIQRLTSSNPSREYVYRVAQAWKGEGANAVVPGEHGNLKSVLKAILLDPEARYAVNYKWNDQGDQIIATQDDLLAGRVKEPIMKWTQFYRYAKPNTNEPNGLVLFQPRTNFNMLDAAPDPGQIPMRAPSVFNFYSSEYSPSTGAINAAEERYDVEITAPELEIMSPLFVREYDELHQIVAQEEPQTSFTYNAGLSPESRPRMTVQFDHLKWLYSRRNSNHVINNINVYLCQGQLSPELRAQLIEIAADSEKTKPEQFAMMLTTLFSSPEYSVSY